MNKTSRMELLAKAAEAAELALARLEKLSNSGNPDVAARATALLVLERNELADIEAVRALVGNTPAAELKPVQEETLVLLGALERSIDERIAANRLVNSGISAVTDVLRTVEAIGQIVQQSA